jgi:hypothetical protein
MTWSVSQEPAIGRTIRRLRDSGQAAGALADQLLDRVRLPELGRWRVENDDPAGRATRQIEERASRVHRSASRGDLGRLSPPPVLVEVSAGS